MQGSGLLLLHDDSIWQVLDDWVTDLNDDAFTALLPLLRRTFSNFPAPEQRQMDQQSVTEENFDRDRAVDSLSLMAALLGLPDSGLPVLETPALGRPEKGYLRSGDLLSLSSISIFW